MTHNMNVLYIQDPGTVLQGYSASTGSSNSWYKDFDAFNFDSSKNTFKCTVKNGATGTAISSDNVVLDLLSE